MLSPEIHTHSIRDDVPLDNFRTLQRRMCLSAIKTQVDSARYKTTRSDDNQEKFCRTCDAFQSKFKILRLPQQATKKKCVLAHECNTVAFGRRMTRFVSFLRWCDRSCDLGVACVDSPLCYIFRVRYLHFESSKSSRETISACYSLCAPALWHA